ncbi:low affinity iron permease family protein [Candidatus Protochlamydia phocaeensis]|uniref:low affinity iron permease family protein n=1 Tax=Candidatus Protochlamydia phocaeensis TaxID=1414722 RepID=UPI0008388207|nr:low affinity iron permease family protein [Candidatus Protochlamydia phocaeensis]
MESYHIPSLSRFLAWSAKMAGKPISFVIALFLLFLWTVIGFIWGFSDSWLLTIDTIATINASLMVFIIQNTQNRESKALHLKIDELIRSNKEAENALIAIEEREEKELEAIKKELLNKIQEKPQKIKIKENGI